MLKKKGLGLMVGLLVFAVIFLQAEPDKNLQLRFFEGVREDTPNPPEFVTSSYLQPTVTASMRSKFSLAEVRGQIKKVFNLKDVRLITEAGLSWDFKQHKKIAHTLQLDEKNYLVFIIPPDEQNRNRFMIEVFELFESSKYSLLDTEIILPEENIAVFGFEDKQGRPYFISFHIPEQIQAGVVSGDTGEDTNEDYYDVSEEDPTSVAEWTKDFTEGVVQIKGEIKPPKLLKQVLPSYPEIARRVGVHGKVMLKVRTNRKGKVDRVKILKSDNHLLDRSAVSAVKQWEYEPFILQGEPIPAVFITTINFKLKDDTEELEESFAKGAVKAVDGIKPPKLIRKVHPVYPVEAKRAGVSGIVILNARTDVDGNVEAVEVLKSPHALLTQAAIEAIKQWKYESFRINGKARPIVFTVTMHFRMK